MLSSHLFLCLACLLPPFTVPCKIVLARPTEREACQHHFSLCVFTVVGKSSCGPIACWILAQASFLVMWYLYEMCSILWKHLISMTCILLCSSTVRVHDSHVYRKMDMTWDHISRILELKEMFLLFQTDHNLVNAAVSWAILESTSGLEPWSDTTDPKYLKHVSMTV